MGYKLHSFVLPMKSKYIFLDIDGVIIINEDELGNEHPIFGAPFNPDCVKVLNKILLATDAEIILTSDWRIHLDYDLKLLNKLFKRNKVIKSPVDTTPDYNGQRAKEIFTYVYNHAYIKSFLILDDMRLSCCSMRFLKTDKKLGLIETGIKEKAIYILNGLNQAQIKTCINCEQEYTFTNDNFACSTDCRKDIEERKLNDKFSITDIEINEYVLNNRLQRH